ncbi:MAG: ABC transporter substrate-binding protein [Chloroflexi bacterium]|nr:ABC transporter substrate-binding protein [Chloroflexota bacterium]
MLMRGLSKSALGLIIAGLLLASCAPAASPSAGATPAAPPPTGPKATVAGPAPTPKAEAAKPDRGGMLNLIHLRTIDNHDIIQLSANFHAYPPYERLFRWAPDLKTLVYELATAWEISKDGLGVTFNLRKGVKWHDGKPFTSADAATTVKWITNPPKGFMSRQQELFAAVKSIEAPDDYTLKLGLKYPSAVLDTSFALGNTVMYPQHVLEAKGSMKDDVVGTGAFKFKRYVPGVSMDYERNKDYWDRELPYLDGLKYYIIVDASARFAAFRTRRVHRHQELSTTEAEVVQKEMSGAQLITYPNPSAVEGLMRVTRPPFDDVRVRRAISLAIDRQALNQFVTQGAGKVGLTMFPGGRWALPDAEIAKLPGYRQPKDQDLAEAKRLLAEAGYAQGLKITNYVQNFPPVVKAATVIREQVARVGIDMEIPLIDVVERQRRLYSEDFGLMTNWITTLGDDPEVATGNVWKMERNSFFQVKLQRPDGSTEVGVADKRANDLLNQIRRAPDFEQRRAATWEIEKHILDQAPILIHVWMPGFTGLWKEVQDYHINPWNMEIYNQVWLRK